MHADPFSFDTRRNLFIRSRHTPSARTRPTHKIAHTRTHVCNCVYWTVPARLYFASYIVHGDNKNGRKEKKKRIDARDTRGKINSATTKKKRRNAAFHWKWNCRKLYCAFNHYLFIACGFWANASQQLFCSVYIFFSPIRLEYRWKPFVCPFTVFFPSILCYTANDITYRFKWHLNAPLQCLRLSCNERDRTIENLICFSYQFINSEHSFNHTFILYHHWRSIAFIHKLPFGFHFECNSGKQIDKLCWVLWS